MHLKNKIVIRSLIFILTFFVLSSLSAYSQDKIQIDSDLLYLDKSIKNKIILDSIVRGKENADAFWIQYDRCPGIDPWMVDNTSTNEENQFILFFESYDIRILGALNTFDDCGCSKERSTGSPDMTLINFKISKSDWERLKEIYPKFVDAKILL